MNFDIFHWCLANWKENWIGAFRATLNWPQSVDQPLLMLRITFAKSVTKCANPHTHTRTSASRARSSTRVCVFARAVWKAFSNSFMNEKCQLRFYNYRLLKHWHSCCRGCCFKQFTVLRTGRGKQSVLVLVWGLLKIHN